MTDTLAHHDTAATTSRVLINRTLLTIGSLACIALFYLTSRQFHVPSQPGYSASLLQQPAWLVALLVTTITFVVAAFVGSSITSRVHRDGGFFCAAIGLATLSFRGGAMRYVLFDATGPSVFLMLAAETVALGAMLALAWTLLDQWPVGKRALEPPLGSLQHKYLATVMQVLLMIALMSLLCRSDTKMQAFASVFVSSWLATLGAQWFSPASPSPWLWSGPLIVALLGYTFCYFSPGGMELGRTSGYFAALARPLPLDYASAGVAGALSGYWMSLKRHESR